MWHNVNYDFSGAHVLITGGTGGLGNSVAKAFADAGANVTITGTRTTASKYDEDLSAFRYMQLDVEDKDNIARVARACARIDILIHSAGLALFSLGLDEHDPDVFERAITMHLSSIFRLSTACRPQLAASSLPGGASVVCMASMSSLFGFDPAPGYGAGKTGLLGVIRSLAVHWAPDQIRVNGIAAGLVASKMTAPVLQMPELANGMLARVPMKRHGLPADITGATLFLSSDAASWITGQTVAIDGGFSICG